MEDKKTYKKPEMEIVEMQFYSELLVESCGDIVPCQDEFDVE